MKQVLIILLVCALIASVSFYLVTPSGESEKSLSDAYQAYRQGEEANTVQQRTESFNKALSLYTNLEKRFNPKYGNGKLYYNIANSYYQLGQYPMAVLYYYRALDLMPKNEKAQRNLQTTLSKLNVFDKTEDTTFNKIFFFHYGFSFSERFRLFFIFALLGTLFGSIYIWGRGSWLKKCAILFALVAAIFLGSIAYTNYFTPVQGVIVKSTSLYRDAGKQYAKVLKEPVLSGTKVEVLDVLHNGHWLKIITPEGILGYVPQNSIKTI